MKIKKECSKNNPRFKMMEDGITLREIEKWYGKKTADELVKYCSAKKIGVDAVAASDSEWDRFEAWAKGKKRGLGTNSSKFDNWKDAARLDDGDKRGRAAKVYDRPTDADIYGEGSGSGMDQDAISSKIYDYLSGCDWVQSMDPRDGDILITVDGRDYSILVEPEMDRMRRYGMSDDEMDELGFDRERQTWMKAK